MVVRIQIYHNRILITIHLLMDLRCLLLNNRIRPRCHHIIINTNSRIPLILPLINNISLINQMHTSSNSNHHRINQCKVSINLCMSSSIITSNILIPSLNIKKLLSLLSQYPHTLIPWPVCLLHSLQRFNNFHRQ
jgi:hypothetical protein